MKRLYRLIKKAAFRGICGGISLYDTDPNLIRIFWLYSFLSVGIGGSCYFLAWIIIPKEPCEEAEIVTMKQE
ncbi:MAG: PspC domain-containing protein [Methanoregulaceae archaeon]|jgi:phage shock protein PspC (stress-responsive transcriptional regulator)|nr:PspC domain-containing protein [Methanoregulaceae archaeon]